MFKGVDHKGESVRKEGTFHQAAAKKDCTLRGVPVYIKDTWSLWGRT